MGLSFENQVRRWNVITEYLATHPDNLTTWNELDRIDCSRTNRTFKAKTILSKIAVRRWYYMLPNGRPDVSYEITATGTPRPCPSIQTYRMSEDTLTIEEAMPVLISLKKYTHQTTGINKAVVPAKATGAAGYCITQDLTKCDDQVYVQVIELCNSLNKGRQQSEQRQVESSPTILAIEYLNEHNIFTSKSYFEDHYSEESVSSFGSHGKCSLATVLYFEFVALQERNVTVRPEMERYVGGMEDKIDDLITGPLAFMHLAAKAMGEIESNNLKQAGRPDVFPQLQAAIQQVHFNPDALAFIRFLSSKGLDCSCRWCTDPNASLIQTSELAKTVQHLSAKAKKAKKEVSNGKTPSACPLSEMMEQFRRAGLGGIVNECKSSHHVTDLSTLINMVLGIIPKDPYLYSERQIQQYGIVVDMSIKYSGGGKCIHSGLSFTRPDAPAISQHHPVFGEGDDGKEVTSVRLIRKNKPDIIISDMNKGGPENCVSSLVHSVTSVKGFLGVVVPEFAKTVLSLENYHQVFHHLERNSDICAKYGIPLLVKNGGCVLLMLEDVPTLKVIVEEIESCGRDEVSITSFENVAYADGDIDTETLDRVEAARCKLIFVCVCVCHSYTLYIFYQHQLTSLRYIQITVKTKYSADAAKRAIQYATESAAEVDSEADEDRMPANEDDTPDKSSLVGRDTAEDDEDRKMPAAKSSLKVDIHQANKNENTMVEANEMTPKSSLKMPTSSLVGSNLKSAEEDLSDDSPSGIAKPSSSDTAAAFELSNDTPSHLKPPLDHKLTSNMLKLDTDSKSAPVDNPKPDGDDSSIIVADDEVVADNLPAIATKSTEVSKKRKPNSGKQSGLGSFFTVSKRLETNRPPEQPPNKRLKPRELREGELADSNRIILREAVWLYGTNWDDVQYHVGKKKGACERYWDKKVSDKDKNDWLGRHAALLSR